MRIVRLSRAPPPSNSVVPGTAPLNSAFSSISPQRENKKSHLITIISTILLPPLLAISLILTLLPLLIPNLHNQSLTYFTIRPIGVERGSSSIAVNSNSNEANALRRDTSVDDDRALHKRQDSTADDMEKWIKIIEGVAGKNDTSDWMGKDGPSIWVGILQICSKSNSTAEVNCTSSSQAEYHAQFLPTSCQSPLTSLPPSPPTPILLLVSAILLVLAIFVFVAGLIPWRCSVSFNCLHRKPHLEANPHWARSPYNRGNGGSESAENLVQGNSKDRKRRFRRERPHMSFFCLMVVALGLTAGSIVQLKIVREAQGNWDTSEAGNVGLVFEMGLLTYLTPILPICLILILLVAASPPIYSYLADTFHTCPSDHENSNAESDMPEITISSPEGGVGKGWDQTSIVNPSPAHIDSPTDPTRETVNIDRSSKTSSSVGKAM